MVWFFSVESCTLSLGQCKARPFNSHRVCFFVSFFVCFSAPIWINTSWTYGHETFAGNESARRCRFFMYILYFPSSSCCTHELVNINTVHHNPSAMPLFSVFVSYCIGLTIRIFWRYNKASPGELVPLEILGKHQQGLTWGILTSLNSSRVWV